MDKACLYRAPAAPANGGTKQASRLSGGPPAARLPYPLTQPYLNPTPYPEPAEQRLRACPALVPVQAEDGAGRDGRVDVARAVQRVEHGDEAGRGAGRGAPDADNGIVLLRGHDRDVAAAPQRRLQHVVLRARQGRSACACLRVCMIS